MKQEDCRHATVRFGSGDYYIFCADCPMRWAAINPSTEGDFVFPEGANKGVGATLSGEVRVTPS